MEAWKMLIRSISSTVAWATDQATARSLMRPARTSRRSGVSTFESARPLIRRFLSRITAAAYPGPASGPRPASSTQHTVTLSISFFPYSPLLQYSKDRFGGLLRRILPQKPGEFAEAGELPLARGLIAPEWALRCRERRGRRVVLQELGHQPLAGEDVG